MQQKIKKLSKKNPEEKSKMNMNEPSLYSWVTGNPIDSNEDFSHPNSDDPIYIGSNDDSS